MMNILIPKLNHSLAFVQEKLSLLEKTAKKDEDYQKIKEKFEEEIK